MENLIRIQKELKAPKNQYNAFGKYKYRNCEDILEAVKPLLCDNGCNLTISDEIKEVGNIIYVEATCTFSDGKETVSVKAQAGINPNRKGMDISQSFGSSSSYARKYALNGLFLIDDTKDADNQKAPESKEDTNRKKEPLKKAGFDYLMSDKGTKENIEMALGNREMTEAKRKSLTEILKTK